MCVCQACAYEGPCAERTARKAYDPRQPAHATRNEKRMQIHTYENTYERQGSNQWRLRSRFFSYRSPPVLRARPVALAAPELSLPPRRPPRVKPVPSRSYLYSFERPFESGLATVSYVIRRRRRTAPASRPCLPYRCRHVAPTYRPFDPVAPSFLPHVSFNVSSSSRTFVCLGPAPYFTVAPE